MYVWWWYTSHDGLAQPRSAKAPSNRCLFVAFQIEAEGSPDRPADRARRRRLAYLARRDPLRLCGARLCSRSPRCPTPRCGTPHRVASILARRDRVVALRLGAGRGNAGRQFMARYRCRLCRIMHRLGDASARFFLFRRGQRHASCRPRTQLASQAIQASKSAKKEMEVQHSSHVAQRAQYLVKIGFRIA